MISRRMSATVFSCTVLALTLSAGCSVNLVGSPITVKKPFTAKVTTKVPATLLIDVPIGSLTIKPGPLDSKEVEVTGTLGGQDQATLDAIVLTVALQDDGTVLVKPKGPNGKSWNAELTVTVPGKSNLTVASGVGSVVVEGLEGRMKAEVGVGDLTLDHIALTGDSSFESGTGNVRLAVLTWPKNATVSVESGTGGATVLLPSKLGLSIDASTGTGKLTTNGLTYQGNPLSKSVVGGTLKGRTELDPEGRTLKATSGTGNVTIEATEK